MNKLKLHVITTNAAATAVGKNKQEVATIMESAWKESGLDSKQDRSVFEFMFNDAQGVCTSYATQKLPSESAAEKYA